MALGDVAGDLGEADQIAVLVADGVHHHIGPEHRAVLAHPPAFGLEAADLGGDHQGAAGEAGLLIGLGIECREMPAEDFLRLIAFQALRARVPAGDDAARIQHIKSVIDHAVDQHAQASLADLGTLLRLAHDQREPKRRAGRIARGLHDRVAEEAAAVMAPAPALDLVPALMAGHEQSLFGNGRRLFLVGEQAGIRLADHLAGGDREQPLGAGIPAGDQAFCVECTDGLVGDGADQRLEPIRRCRRRGRGGLCHTRSIIRLLHRAVNRRGAEASKSGCGQSVTATPIPRLRRAAPPARQTSAPCGHRPTRIEARP